MCIVHACVATRRSPLSSSSFREQLPSSVLEEPSTWFPFHDYMDMPNCNNGLRFRLLRCTYTNQYVRRGCVISVAPPWTSLFDLLRDVLSDIVMCTQNKSLFPVQLFSLDEVLAGNFAWQNMTTDVRVCLVIIGAHCFICFWLWFLAAPLLDVLFICTFASIRLSSFFLVVLTFRDFRTFDGILQLKANGILPEIGRYFLFVLALEPVRNMTNLAL